jgi:hypothetical protein
MQLSESSHFESGELLEVIIQYGIGLVRWRYAENGRHDTGVETAIDMKASQNSSLTRG